MKISSRGGVTVENCFFSYFTHLYSLCGLPSFRILALTPISCDSSQNPSFEAEGISTCNYMQLGKCRSQGLFTSLGLSFLFISRVQKFFLFFFPVQISTSDILNVHLTHYLCVFHDRLITLISFFNCSTTLTQNCINQSL